MISLNNSMASKQKSQVSNPADASIKPQLCSFALMGQEKGSGAKEFLGKIMFLLQIS